MPSSLARTTTPRPISSSTQASQPRASARAPTKRSHGPHVPTACALGPRPLVEDDSRRSKATTLASLRIGYALSNDAKLTLDVFNLFDRRASDIDYYYASRLRGEPPQGVSDVHFHPVEPRSARVTLVARF